MLANKHLFNMSRSKASKFSNSSVTYIREKPVSFLYGTAQLPTLARENDFIN